MKREVWFTQMSHIGDLFLDYVFFEFEMEPLLFTCVDKSGNLYFCHCYKLIYEQKWFVVPISVETLEDVIEGINDIRTTILSAKEVLEITRDATGKDTHVWKNVVHLVQEDLPAKGIGLKCDQYQARLYISTKKDNSIFSRYFTPADKAGMLRFENKLFVKNVLHIDKNFSSEIKFEDIEKVVWRTNKLQNNNSYSHSKRTFYDDENIVHDEMDVKFIYAA